MFPVRRISLAAIVLCSPQLLWAQTASSVQAPEPETSLQTVTVEASADASAQGLVNESEIKVVSVAR